MMIDSLDHAEWSPPAPPLSLGEIQRGIAPVSYVRNERASDPFENEFDHWSALPALSYFALNAVTLRESLRRIPPPSSFRPPPRLTLSDQRRQAWLNDLKNPQIPLRTLSRAVPHGYTSTKLLQMLTENEIPIFRGVWFIKCIGANEVRALKRKARTSNTSGGGESSEHARIEQMWLNEWTHAVILVIEQIINSFDEIRDPSMNDDEHDDQTFTNKEMNNSNEMEPEALPAGDVDETVTVVKSSADENEGGENDDDSMNELFGDDDAPTGRASNAPTPNANNTNNAPTPVTATPIAAATPHNAATPSAATPNAATPIAAASTAATPVASTPQPSTLSVEIWQKRMEYASRLSFSLYNSSLIERKSFLEWIIEGLRECSIGKLPCYVHFVQLLWKPINSSSFAPKLLRTIAHRYSALRGDGSSASGSSSRSHTDQNSGNSSSSESHSSHGAIVTTLLEPLVFKLLSTNETVFVTPRTWPILEPYVRNHPAYARIAQRNQAFMPQDQHDPSDWSQPLAIGALLENFARPYQVDELIASFKSLEVDTEVLVRTILLRTLRQGTSGSIALCVALLRKLAGPGDKGKTGAISEYCVEFLLDHHLVYGSECLGALVSELIRSRLCYLERYISKLISRDILHGTNEEKGSSVNDDDEMGEEEETKHDVEEDESACQSGFYFFSGAPRIDHDLSLRELHLRILQDLPFDWLAPNLLTQVTTMLWRAGVASTSKDLKPLVNECAQVLAGKKSASLGAKIRRLHVNDSHRLSDRLIELFEEKSLSPETMPTDPAVFSQFAELLDIAGTGNMRPLYKVLVLAVSSPFAQPAIVGCALRQVHIRLMAFVCSGLIDPFVRHLLVKLGSGMNTRNGSSCSIGSGSASANGGGGGGSNGNGGNGGTSGGGTSGSGNGSSTNSSLHSHLNAAAAAAAVAAMGGSSDAGHNSSRCQNVFQWVSWDDVCALRAVIQSPDIMCKLNSVIPLRQSATSVVLSAGQTPVERDACIRNALYKPGCPDIGALLTMRGDDSLSHDIVEWANSPGADRTALLQLLTYHAVSIDELVEASPDRLMFLRFFLLAPANEMGFCFEEVEALRLMRYKYLSQLPLDAMVELIASVPPIECASRIAHVYPDLYINHVVIPAMANESTMKCLKKATSVEVKRFEVLFLRCTPFNLRFYQGLVILVFHGMPVESIAAEILQTAHAHPEASPALQGLLQYLQDDVKNMIFTKTVERFLTVGLTEGELPSIDVHYTLIGALASSVTARVQWSLEAVPAFLEQLVALADQRSASHRHVSRKVLHKALILVLRISVVARLHEVELPAAAVPYLEKLLLIQVFADNHKIRTIIEDALRLLLRIARKGNDDRHVVLVNDDDQRLSAGPNATDGLRVYSKSRDEYDALPVWAFDLIEDANPTIGKNDGAIDLALFEAYEV